MKLPRAMWTWCFNQEVTERNWAYMAVFGLLFVGPFFSFLCCCFSLFCADEEIDYEDAIEEGGGYAESFVPSFSETLEVGEISFADIKTRGLLNVLISMQSDEEEWMDLKSLELSLTSVVSNNYLLVPEDEALDWFQNALQAQAEIRGKNLLRSHFLCAGLEATSSTRSLVYHYIHGSPFSRAGLMGHIVFTRNLLKKDRVPYLSTLSSLDIATAKNYILAPTNLVVANDVRMRMPKNMPRDPVWEAECILYKEAPRGWSFMCAQVFSHDRDDPNPFHVFAVYV